MSFVPINPKISFIQSESGARFPYSNSLLIRDERTVLIDTGLESILVERIAKEYSVDLVINSHCHEDHIAGNYLFPESQICAHKLATPIIKSVDQLIEIYDLRHPELEVHMLELMRKLSLRDSRVDIEYEGDHVFHLGNTRLQVLHTPGHSPGHCCFLIPEENLIFLSDIDLTSFSPWYGALNSDLDSFIASIEKLKRMRFEIAVTSHKVELFKGYKNIQEKLTQYLNRIYQREEKLLNFLEIEHTLEEIVNQAIIYGKFHEPVATFKHMEKIMIQKHLDRLLVKGKVEKTGKRYKMC
ncbi:MAG: MBL fold metallo-hydrolase [Candidatus Heimdallarchaeota archaeon]